MLQFSRSKQPIFALYINKQSSKISWIILIYLYMIRKIVRRKIKTCKQSNINQVYFVSSLKIVFLCVIFWIYGIIIKNLYFYNPCSINIFLFSRIIYIWFFHTTNFGIQCPNQHSPLSPSPHYPIPHDPTSPTISF